MLYNLNISHNFSFLYLFAQKTHSKFNVLGNKSKKKVSHKMKTISANQKKSTKKTLSFNVFINILLFTARSLWTYNLLLHCMNFYILANYPLWGAINKIWCLLFWCKTRKEDVNSLSRKFCESWNHPLRISFNVRYKPIVLIYLKHRKIFCV